MRSIRLILTDKINYSDFNEKKVYKFDKNNSDEKELKIMVIDINKSNDERVCLITNKEDLFEFFNRTIECEYFNSLKIEEGYEYSDSLNSYKDSIPKKEIKLNTDLYFGRYDRCKKVGDIFNTNIFEILDAYGSIFNIDIKRLIKGTTYKVNTKEELKDLIYEDLNLILSKGIVTSRLCVVFYRLTYFDLDASKVSVGRFFSRDFGKSESFNINLNRNPDGWFFTDLNNKIFRGYKIKDKSQFYRTREDDIFDAKIKIARKLLSNGVKIKIVAESIEIEETELKDIIYKEPSYRSRLGLK